MINDMWESVKKEMFTQVPQVSEIQVYESKKIFYLARAMMIAEAGKMSSTNDEKKAVEIMESLIEEIEEFSTSVVKDIQ